MKHLLIFCCLIIFGYQDANGQTCCSGGVPVSANLGLPAAAAGSWQFSMAYDENQLRTLYSESEILNDESRLRITRSMIFEMGYAVSSRWSVDIFFSLVQQVREIKQGILRNEVSTFGAGDLAVLAKFQLLKSNQTEWTIGAGPKLPTGASTLKDERGIALIADLQPGSGAADFVLWTHFSQEIKWRPSLGLSINSIFSQKGINKNYLESQEYQFGNEWQASVGLGDRLLLKNIIVDPAVALRYRKAWEDHIDGGILPNTGGQWLFLEPSLTYWPKPNLNISAGAALPIYANLVGTQLSPSFRWNLSVFKRIDGKIKSNQEITIPKID